MRNRTRVHKFEPDAFPAQRRARIEDRAMELATLKVLRKDVEASRKDLSALLDVAPNAVLSSN